MVLDEPTSADQLFWDDNDFPNNYKNCHHPDDLQDDTQPIPPMVFLHQHPRHSRLLLRISFKKPDGQYFSTTFVCSTGLPRQFYFGKTTLDLLNNAGMIKHDTEMDCSYIEVAGRKVLCDRTPSKGQPAEADAIGLKALMGYGLCLSDDNDCPGTFTKLPAHF
eukprot:TRINITY_DN67949_c5_g3_i3.p2 TRINITY_DN67949_c5_g3~~TRINITY_DN67949_c5_g3_i3.p2  ORF type:complete len:163 (-),score=21.32 TRINITY_DN67949_c5_g3_i3:661-1149(-)